MKGKKLFSTVLGLFLAGSVQSWAISGGPWDHLSNDSFSNSNPDGLYEATVSVKNGSGFVRFSQTKESEVVGPLDFTNLEAVVQLVASSGVGVPTSVLAGTLASQSNSVIFLEGNAYFGNTYGLVDLNSGTVTGVGTGQSMIVDQIQQTATTAAQNLNAIVDITGLSETMSLNFVGKVTSRVPQVRFAAKGEVFFFSRPGITVTGAAGGTPIIQVQGGGQSTTTRNDTRTINTLNTLNQTLTFTGANGFTGTVTDLNTDGRVQSIVNNFTATTVNGGPLQPDTKRTIRLFGGRISRAPQVGTQAQRDASAANAQ